MHSYSLGAGRAGDRIPVGKRFSAPVQKGPGAHPASYAMGAGSSPGVTRPRRGVYHPNQSWAEVKERVERNLYFPSEPSWPVLGWILYTVIVFKWIVGKLSVTIRTGLKFVYLQYTVLCLTSRNVLLFYPIATLMYTTCHTNSHTLNIMPIC
jgi:hypothetical protein